MCDAITTKEDLEFSQTINLKWTHTIFTTPIGRLSETIRDFHSDLQTIQTKHVISSEQSTFTNTLYSENNCAEKATNASIFVEALRRMLPNPDHNVSVREAANKIENNEEYTTLKYNFQNELDFLIKNVLTLDHNQSQQEMPLLKKKYFYDEKEGSTFFLACQTNTIDDPPVVISKKVRDDITAVLSTSHE